ncbi:hypothetical protein Avbf_17664 [Armadillidium vulgare]|nr:hypothetical protein Avbf_17664 [Armadillidium vulgare]
MSDDDDFGDLDLPSEASESDPISDVNPDEMAKLMADLDDVDDEIFKSGTKKETPKTLSSQSDKDNKKSSLPIDKKETKIDDDAEKLSKQNSEEKKELNRDSENTKQQSPEYSKEVKVETDLLEKTPSADKRKDFIKESSKAKEKSVENLPVQVSPKKDKRKVISDLFDETESVENKVEKPIKPDKKATRDVTFDDDSDPLDMGTKSKASDSGYLDSLLGTSSLSKPSKKTTVEFSLPDKYKGSEDDRKSNSPMKKKSSDSFEDLFGDTDSRPRRTQGGRRNKSFNFDDDDILGNDKSKQKKSTTDEAEQSKTLSRKAPKDDWLFGPPKSPPKVKEEEEDRSKDHKTNPSPSPKKEDWLNQMLTSNKTSPAKSQNIKPTSQITKDSSKDASKGSPYHVSVAAVTKPLNETVTTLSPAYNTIIQSQLAEQQSKIQADVAAMTSLLQVPTAESRSRVNYSVASPNAGTTTTI